MSDRMDADTYKLANIKAALVANTIETLPLSEMLDAQEHAHAIGPLLDPTLYRDKMDAMQIDGERTRILLRAQRELTALRAKHEAKRR